MRRLVILLNGPAIVFTLLAIAAMTWSWWPGNTSSSTEAANGRQTPQSIGHLGPLPVELAIHRKLQNRQHRGMKASAYYGMKRTGRVPAHHAHAPLRDPETGGTASQALDAALADYRRRHEQCTAGTKPPGQYIVTVMADQSAGLGNQLPSIITGFLLALLTERCFFVHFPFYHRSFAPQLDFTWQTHKERLRAFGHDVDTAPPLGIPFWRGEEASAWLLQDQKALYGAHHGIALNNDPDYTAALLQANAFHAPQLRRLFPTGEIFHALAPFLLKVKPELEQQVQDFRRAHFGRVMIGMQIRLHKCDAGELSIHCGQLPEVVNFVAGPRALQRARGLDDSEVRFFVGADKPEIYIEVDRLLGDDMVIYRRDNGVGTVTSPNSTAANPGVPQSGLIDLRLLSECADLVITVASSYGSVAAAWGGVAPVHMLHGPHANVQNPYWYRQITSEPCYWKANVFLPNKAATWGRLGANETSAWKSSPFWMQYTQCHMAM